MLNGWAVDEIQKCGHTEGNVRKESKDTRWRIITMQMTLCHAVRRSVRTVWKTSVETAWLIRLTSIRTAAAGVENWILGRPDKFAVYPILTVLKPRPYTLWPSPGCLMSTRSGDPIDSMLLDKSSAKVLTKFASIGLLLRSICPNKHTDGDYR